MSSKNQPKKLLWVDLEMSGLNVEKEVIIEVAAIVTDIQLNTLDKTYHAIVKQPQSYIDGMDEWNRTQHGKSGLIEKIPNGTLPDVVETELCEFIEHHFSGEPAILSGNSIGQDRKFIDRYFPKVAALLHYRLLDVTSWKIIMENQFDVFHEKKDTHRATDDILESIEELKTYIAQVKST